MDGWMDGYLLHLDLTSQVSVKIPSNSIVAIALALYKFQYLISLYCPVWHILFGVVILQPYQQKVF